MSRRVLAFVGTLLLGMSALPADAAALPGPLAQLQSELYSYSEQAPGRVALAVTDVATGLTTGYNAGEEMPAASTIKIPVMVEVFRQLGAGNFDLNRRLHLMGSDKDWGSGDLCDAPAGSSYTVSRLLALMIDDSDNTATNMLIRLVGRAKINATMQDLGLTHTRLSDFIRSEGPIRHALRSTPADMGHLLVAMAREKLVDEWSSRQMIAILAADHINTLLPVPLPPGTTIAHKTGSLHDTLNDVGIVYPNDAAQPPYVVAVMTTDLSSLGAGRRVIHGVSRMAYNALTRFGSWRAQTGFTLPTSADTVQPDISAPQAVPAPQASLAPDVRMWTPRQPDSDASAGS
ncbi:MAG: serine hydrolase [Candidatus Eremiobacteraeota bacterium]|nr:serine hydrolase [Candidatus Eremiobacteraeota bacterium]